MPRSQVPVRVDKGLYQGSGQRNIRAWASYWNCLDCRQPTHRDALNEFYMVQAEVWHGANPGGRGMLCVGCLESRLGRRLTPADFTSAPINSPGGQSPRLLSRIQGTT